MTTLAAICFFQGVLLGLIVYLFREIKFLMKVCAAQADQIAELESLFDSSSDLVAAARAVTRIMSGQDGEEEEPVMPIAASGKLH